jgi:type II secretory pathway component GspD/PulD (secretin)
MPRIVVGLSLALIAMMASAQALEVISLKYRTADQVLDTLRPLVEPGGVLSGQGSQLIVRASARNVAEIRRALEAIDRPGRRLQVSVRFDDAFEASQREMAASGTISNRGARVEVRGNESQRQAIERVDQRLQVMDGGRAMIQTGRATVRRDVMSGFEVVPRLSGDAVTIDIYASRAGSTTVSSSVTSRLGEWFELGSVAASPGSETRRVFVKVEAVRN